MGARMSLTSPMTLAMRPTGTRSSRMSRMLTMPLGGSFSFSWRWGCVPGLEEEYWAISCKKKKTNRAQRLCSSTGWCDGEGIDNMVAWLGDASQLSGRIRLAGGPRTRHQITFTCLKSGLQQGRQGRQARGRPVHGPLSDNPRWGIAARSKCPTCHSSDAEHLPESWTVAHGTKMTTTLGTSRRWSA